MKNFVTDTFQPSDVFDAKVLAFPFMENGGCAVENINPINNPSDIARFIVPVIVDPVQCVFWRRFFADIFEKCGKVIAPFFAHGYSPSTIPVKTSVIFVKATGFCVLPTFIFWCLFSVNFIPMFQKPVSGYFLFQATTAFGVAGLKRIRAANNFITAITKAFPINPNFLSDLFFDSGIGNKSAISVTC